MGSSVALGAQRQVLRPTGCAVLSGQKVQFAEVA